MYSLIYCFSFFLLAFLLHLILSYFIIIKKPVIAILIIFSFSLFVSLFFVWFYEILQFLYIEYLLTEYIRISLLFISMTFVYCFVYISLIDDSPSLFIIMNIYNSGEKGMSKAELGLLINDDIFIKPRLKYLIEEKMVKKSKDNLLLTTKGKKLLSIFIFIQKIMKMPLKPG